MSAWPLATYSPSQILWLTSRLVPSSASESISSSSCGYASHTAWRFRCERGFQQHQTRRPKTSKTSLGIVQRLLLSTKGILHHHRDILCVVVTANVTVLLRVCTFRHCAYFSCYDVAALCQKVTEFRRVWPRTKTFPLRVGVVYIAALQQIIFNADIKVDQHRSYHPLEN